MEPPLPLDDESFVVSTLDPLESRVVSTLDPLEFFCWEESDVVSTLEPSVLDDVSFELSLDLSTLISSVLLSVEELSTLSSVDLTVVSFSVT